MDPDDGYDESRPPALLWLAWTGFWILAWATWFTLRIVGEGFEVSGASGTASAMENLSYYTAFFLTFACWGAAGRPPGFSGLAYRLGRLRGPAEPAGADRPGRVKTALDVTAVAAALVSVVAIVASFPAAGSKQHGRFTASWSGRIDASITPPAEYLGLVSDAAPLTGLGVALLTVAGFLWFFQWILE